MRRGSIPRRDAHFLFCNCQHVSNTFVPVLSAIGNRPPPAPPLLRLDLAQCGIEKNPLLLSGVFCTIINYLVLYTRCYSFEASLPQVQALAFATAAVLIVAVKMFR
jgi:hypothetical protein